MKDKQWVGKTLYKMEADEFDIYSLNVQIIGDEMNIFYLLAGTCGSYDGVIMHCIWNGREVKINTIKEITLISNLKEHYTINLNNKNNIDLFFITDEGNELSVNYCSFNNQRWSTAIRLYGIQGENIDFDSIRYNHDIHILNKYKEGYLYFLEHVHLNQRGNINVRKVYESEKELKESILFVEGNVLYSCWLEEWKIFYSLFDGERWSNAFFVDKGNGLKVDRYNCFIYSEKEASIKKTKVYATDELDFLLLEPSKLVKKMNQTAIVKINEINKNVIEKVKKDEEEEVQVLNLELASIKLEKKELEKKIESLNIQLQRKDRTIGEYEDEIARILEQKEKVDEHYKIFLELQQKLQKGLEEKNEQLLREREINKAIENELKSSNEENKELKQRVQIMSGERDKLYKEKEQLLQENEKLKEQLESEKNKSIVDRLLKKDK